MSISLVKVSVNGSEYNLTYNESTGAYEGSITAPSKSSFNESGGYYNVEVTVYDEYGNTKTVNSADSSFGDQLKLYVTETTEPTITIISPTDNSILANNKPTISWKVQDADSGINASTIKLYIDDAEVDGTINVSSSSGVYTCTYVPTTSLSDGTHTIKYSVSDNDGNSKTSTISITVDTVAPSLNVSSPEDNLYTNVTPITVYGYTNDLTTSPVTLTVNGKSVSVDSNGYFTTTVDLTSGENTITVISTDGAGKTTTVTRTVYYNNVSPTFKNISITPNPVSVGEIFNISVIVSDS